METCKAVGILGEWCRDIPGRDINSCYLLKAVEAESAEDGLLGIKSLLEDIQDCSFRGAVMNRLEEKIKSLFSQTDSTDWLQG